MASTINSNINKEWEHFISCKYSSDDENEDDDDEHEFEEVNLDNLNATTNVNAKDSPVATNIYISTKTKISYLNQEVNLKDIFWNIIIYIIICH
jgi:hypothetical protein